MTIELSGQFTATTSVRQVWLGAASGGPFPTQTTVDNTALITTYYIRTGLHGSMNKGGLMPANQSILIVEDDAVLREALAENLSSEHGFSVSTAATLNEADGTINAGDAHIDAVILDVGMPDGDGRDYCAMLRRQGHKMPVIMLTGSRTEADVVRRLEWARMTTFASRSAPMSCSQGFAPSCANSTTARKLSFPSDHISSSPPRGCCTIR